MHVIDKILNSATHDYYNHTSSLPTLPRLLRLPQHFLIPPRIITLPHRRPPQLNLHLYSRVQSQQSQKSGVRYEVSMSKTW
jgi:hypothetical protein